MVFDSKNSTTNSTFAKNLSSSPFGLKNPPYCSGGIASLQREQCLDGHDLDDCAEVQEDFIGFGLAAGVPTEIFRRISQNFSPAGVTSPFVARAMPTDIDSVVPVRGR
jgi:hypothetical protein